MYTLRALDIEGNIYWYTGKAGPAWLSTKAANAFVYEDKELAQYRATTFNRKEPIHGYWFIAVMQEAVQ